MLLRKYIAKLPATLCLALTLTSVFAYAEDSALINEANTSLSQKDYSGAFSKFSVLAEHGNATAQFNLGAFYLNGQGVQKDEKRAFEWFAKSAAQGNARALQIIQNAAAKGNENAKNELNKLQPRTVSTPSQPPGQAQQPAVAPGDDKAVWEEANSALAQKNYNVAFPKFSVLAQHGNAIAQFNLGAFYTNGQGVQKDEKQAFDWFAKAAAQGNAGALQVIQNAAAKGNQNAKNVYEKFAPAKIFTPSNGTDVKAKDSATTAATTAGLAQSTERSSPPFSVGLNFGQTGKLSGINNSTSFGLSAGYKFTPNIGVELAYNTLYRNANADTFISGRNPGQTGTFDLTALSLAGQYIYAINSNWGLLANLGVHSSSNSLKSSASASRSGSSNGLVAGLKLQYDVSKNIGIRGGFDTYTERDALTGTLTEIGLGVIYKF
jgi:TPR repeat protein